MRTFSYVDKKIEFIVFLIKQQNKVSGRDPEASPEQISWIDDITQFGYKLVF